MVNAVRHAGGPTAVVARSSGDDLLLIVEDCGPGVTLDERSAIFGRFHRGRAANQPDAPSGTGLGLALVDEHVRLHGGTVAIDDSACGGARFTVRLPALRP